MGALALNTNEAKQLQDLNSGSGPGLSPCAALRRQLPCDLAHVRPIANEGREFLAKAGIPETELLAYELALVEACNNAVLYASDQSQPIEIHVLCGNDWLELQVIDHTKGFDWPEVVELPRAEAEHGRGLFIIQSLMDEAHYLRGARENRLIMRKRRNAELSADPKESLAPGVTNAVAAMSREICFRSAEVDALLRCASQFGNTRDLSTFSQSLLEDLRKISGADWFVLRLISPDGSQLVTANVSLPDLNFEPLAMPANPGEVDMKAAKLPHSSPRRRAGPLGSRSKNLSHSLERRAALSLSDVLFSQERPLSMRDPLAIAAGTTAGVVHPILMRNNLLGTLALGRSSSREPFTENQIEAIRIFSDFLAIQIINFRLQQEHIESRLLGHELDIARRIQESLLPKAFPSLCGFGFAGFSLSARQVGGDFYDVLPVSEDRALLVVADVMGKGVPAALFAATLRTLIRTTAEWTARPGELLGRINRLMFEELSGVDMFITATVGLLDATRKKLSLANAGHCQVLLADKSGSAHAINPDGMPLGIVPTVAFEEKTISLEDFRCALFYTDGVIESRNAHGEFFGEERLKLWLTKGVSQIHSASQFSEELLSEINSFQGAIPSADDQTFLILCEELPRPQEDESRDNTHDPLAIPAICSAAT